jgi:Starch-binding associating with outer membrane
MKNLKIKTHLLSTFLMLLLLASCTKKIDEVYSNPNANVKQPVELLLPNIISNMCISFTAQGNNYGPQNDGRYVGRYVQYWATNTPFDQYDQMGQTNTNNTSAAADIGGAQWASHYYGMGQNLNKVIEWGTDDKKWDYVGVAYAMRAFGWLGVTDMHGEAILKDAFNTNLLIFKYDTQAEIYEEVKKNCRLAIENLNKTGDGVDAANLAKGAAYITCKGDVNKWKKFTYAIMARVFHRTTNKASYQADSVIYYANLAANTNADNTSILFAGGSTSSTNSFYGFFRGNIGVFKQTRFAADLFSGNNNSFLGVADPRAWYMLRENNNNTFKGIRPRYGSPDGLVANDIPQDFWGGLAAVVGPPAQPAVSGSNAKARYIFKDDMPWPLVTAAEMQFLKAEAYYRKGDKAQALAAYTSGISLNIDWLVNDYSASVPVAKLITPAQKAAFMANPSVVPSIANFNLSHIMLQKYIALYGHGFMETWADMRRFHYVDVETGTARQVYTDFAPPSTADLFINNNGKLIYRVRPRFNSEFLYNIDALTTIGALALDFHTKEQWFSQP